MKKRGIWMGRQIWMQWLIWVFFLYGILEFVKKFLYRYRWHREKVSRRITLVVKDGEGYIEGLLRIVHGHGFAVDVLDDHSQDATKEIVQRLSDELENIYLIEGNFQKVAGDLSDSALPAEMGVKK